MSLWDMLAQQFRNPTGWGGMASTAVMRVMNAAQYRTMIKMVEDRNVICDIGFGNGVFMQQLLKDEGCLLYGTEISKTMLEHATKRFAKEKHRVILKKATVEKLPFPNASFDAICSSNTIYFWQDLDAGLQEIKRCMKLDGIGILAFYEKRWMQKNPIVSSAFHLYDHEAVIQALEKNGLVVTSIKHLRKGTSICLAFEQMPVDKKEAAL